MKRFHFILASMLLLCAIGAKAAILSVTLNSPANGTTVSTSIPSFNATAISSTDETFDCDLVINSYPLMTYWGAENSTEFEIIDGADPFSEGEYVWSVSCTDSESTLQGENRTLIVDMQDLWASITSPQDNTTYSSGDFLVYFMIIDSVDDTIYYTIYRNGVAREEDIANDSIEFTLTEQFLPEGAYTYMLHAYDDLDNEYNSTETTIYIDTTDPGADISTEGSYQSSRNVTLNFTVTDTIDTSIRWTVYIDSILNGSGYAPPGVPQLFDIFNLVEGSHVISVVASDDANHDGTSVSLPIITVDYTAPLPLIAGPADGTWTQDSKTEMAFNITDNLDGTLDYTFYVDGIANVTGSLANSTDGLVNITLEEGVHDIFLEALDDAGNGANTTPIQITVDSTPPEARIISPANGTTTSDTTPAITFNLTDNLDPILDYIVYVDGAVAGTGNASDSTQATISLPTLSQGSHSIVVEAADDAGLRTNSSGWAIRVYVPGTSSRPRGSGGGGGGTTYRRNSTGRINTSQEEAEPAILNISGKSHGIREIVSKDNRRAVAFRAYRLPGRPGSIAIDAPGKVNMYLEISAEAKDAESMIGFSVEKKWLAENGIAKEDIVLLRYHDGTWMELSTHIASEIDTEVLYESVTPGFSYFAVSGITRVAQPIQETADPIGPAPDNIAPAEPTIEADLSTEEKSEPAYPWAAALIVLALIVILIAIVYSRMRR